MSVNSFLKDLFFDCQPSKCIAISSQKKSVLTLAAPEQHCCDQCDYVTSRRGDLVKHKRIHSGLKPFECKICKRRFKQSSHLSVHMRRHR